MSHEQTLVELAAQTVAMMETLGIAPNLPTPNEYGKLVTNLALLYNSAIVTDDFEAQWALFLNHLLYPDHRSAPQGLFRLPYAELPHYKLALEALDEIYSRYGDD
jgi:hypothetical protein